MKKIISLTLAAVMMLAVFAGCSIQPNPYKDDPELAEQVLHPEESAAPDESPAPDESEPALGHDFAAARAAYDGDMVVATVNGLEVTWDEYFFWLMSSLMNLENYVGLVTDFSEDFGGMTYAEYVKDVAEYNCMQYRSVDYFAAQEGITLSEEGQQALDDQIAYDISAYSPDGTEEGFNTYLEECYTDRETYDYVNYVSMLFAEALRHYCGDNFELITDDEALAYADEIGFMCAKHILFKTVDDSYQPLSDEVIAEKKALAEQVCAEINTAADPAAVFDEYMAEYNEDTGASYYPDGYCFAPGEMVTAFEEGAGALAPGEVTAVPVESEYGYHIILRCPLTPDSIYMGQQASIRQLAGTQKFSDIVDAWFEQTEIVYTEGFEPDVAALFAVKEAAE